MKYKEIYKKNRSQESEDSSITCRINGYHPLHGAKEVMKEMHRRMKWLPLLVLLFAAFAQAASADEAENSVQQKFEALKEAGYFEGYTEDFSDDRTLNRAQLAKLLVLLEGLSTDSSNGENASGGGACGYTDVDPADEYAPYIEAVTKAKLMIGTGCGTFDPFGDVSVEQLVTVAIRAMNLPVLESGWVSGEVSDWAQHYVATALENGLIKPRDNYKVAADRNSLVETAYGMNEQHVEENGFGMTTAKQIGAKRIAVSLNTAPDPSDIEIAVVRLGDGTPAGIESLEWSEYGRQVVVRLTEPLEGGKYEVSISGSDSIDPSRAAYAFLTEAERVARLEWGGPDTLPYNDNVEVPFFVLNQFDEAMDTKDLNFTFAAANASIERIPERSAVLVHLLEKAKPGGYVDLTILYAKSALFKSKIYQVGESRVVSAIEIDGVPTEPLATGRSAELIVRVYDQYGGLIKDADWLIRELVTESANSRLAAVTPLIPDGSGNIVCRVTAGWTVQGDETVNITVRTRSGSASASATLIVKTDYDVITPPFVISPGNPTVTDEVYTVGSNFAYVTIETDNATRVYYYYERKDASPDVYPASEVMSKALAKQRGDSVAVSADKASFTLMDLDFGQEYELFVVAANASGRLSDVKVYEITAGYLSSYMNLVYDGSNPDTGRCVFVYDSTHEANPDAYYLIADQPVHATVDEIIGSGTKVDRGMFVFELNGRVQYLYVVYNIGGEYEWFAYASDTFPEF